MLLMTGKAGYSQAVIPYIFDAPLCLRYNECSMPKFVVQEHHAAHLHFDFRLEMDGLLRSWAVPKGPSMDPKDRRLAVMVEDHALEYASFEGLIPEGQYGAGSVLIWDSGEYEPIDGGISENRLAFVLKGRKLKGGFTLVKMSGKDREWLLIKKKDQFAQESFVMQAMLTLKKKKRSKG